MNFFPGQMLTDLGNSFYRMLKGEDLHTANSDQNQFYPEFLTLNYNYNFRHLQGDDLKIATFFLDINLSQIFAAADSSRRFKI